VTSERFRASDMRGVGGGWRRRGRGRQRRDVDGVGAAERSGGKRSARGARLYAMGMHAHGWRRAHDVALRRWRSRSPERAGTWCSVFCTSRGARRCLRLPAPMSGSAAPNVRFYGKEGIKVRQSD